MTSVFIYSRTDPIAHSPVVKGESWIGFTEQHPYRPLGFSTNTLASPPKVVVSDVDSTLIEEEVIDQLAELCGVGAKVSAITERAMQGELNFAQSLTERVALLRGLRAEALVEVSESLSVRSGAQRLIDWVHAAGGVFAVVSGGFTPVVAELARHLGIDFSKANGLEIAEGRLTGRVDGPIVTPTVKQQFLESLRKRFGGPVAAMGDGANDLPMLAAADQGIAVLAKPSVRQAATSQLEVAQLDAVIGLLGFSDSAPLNR